MLTTAARTVQSLEPELIIEPGHELDALEAQTDHVDLPAFVGQLMVESQTRLLQQLERSAWGRVAAPANRDSDVLQLLAQENLRPLQAKLQRHVERVLCHAQEQIISELFRGVSKATLGAWKLYLENSEVRCLTPDYKGRRKPY